MTSLQLIATELADLNLAGAIVRGNPAVVVGQRSGPQPGTIRCAQARQVAAPLP